MTTRNIAIRLGGEGAPQVKRMFDDLATHGDASMRRLARSVDRTGQDVENAAQRHANAVAKAHAAFGAITPVNLERLAGNRDDVGRSAEASASVFTAAYAKMEARARALVLAIDPVAAAQDRFNREMQGARELMSAGVLSSDAYAQKLAHEQQALDRVTDALKRKSAAEQGVTYGGIDAARVQAIATTAPDIGRSAEASASVFAEHYERMEARARALVLAIDPVAAAQDRFNREMQDARELLAAGALSSDAYSAKLEHEQQALDRVTAALKRKSAAAQGVSYGGIDAARVDALAGGTGGKSAQESASAFADHYDQLAARARSLMLAIDPVAAAQDRFNREIEEARSLVSAGVLSLDDYTAKLRHEKAALDIVTSAKARDAQMSGLQRAGYQQLGFQINDLAASYGSGASVMTIFMQQSGQLFQALGMIAEGGTKAGAAIDQAGGASDDAAVDVGGLAESVGGVTERVEGATGKFGAFIGFMSGPWGAGVLAAVAVLSPFVMKLLEAEDTLDDVVAKLKEDAAASAKADLAKQAFGRSLEGLVEAIRAEESALKDVAVSEESAAVRAATHTREIRNRVLAIRLETQALLERELAKRQALEDSDFANTDPRAAAIAKRDRDDRITFLEKRLEEAKRATDAAQRLLNIRMVDVISENAEAMSDPVKRITKQYDDLEKAVRNRARAANDGSQKAAQALERELLAIKKNRDAAIEAEQAKQRELTRTTRTRDGDTATAASVAKMLRAEVPGVHVTSTTGGKHVKNSYHYRNQAIDFVPPGGMGSMTKEDVRRIFSARGIDIIELLGPGDKGHSDHFHVAWAKGKASLDEFADAAKRAKDEADALADLTRQYAPLTAATDAYRKTLAEIERLKPANAGELRAGARGEYLETRGRLLAERIGLPGLEAGAREEQGAIDKSAEEAKRRADFVKGMLGDQAEAMELARGELSLAAANDNFRDRALTKLRLIADLKRGGVTADSAQGVLILANAEAYEEVIAQLQRQRAIWDEIRGFGSDFVNTVLSPDTWDDWGEGGKRVLSMLKAEFVKLALLNPVRNALFGEKNPTLGSVFGALGKLFGAATPAAPAVGGSQGFIGPPGNAAGTHYWSGGMMLAGEFGPELVHAPRGSQVIPAGETRRMLSGGSGGSAGRMQVEVVPTPYFDVRVRRVAAPDIQAGMAQAATVGAAGGAAMGQAEATAARTRRLGRGW